MQKRILLVIACLALVGLFYGLGRMANPYLGPDPSLLSTFTNHQPFSLSKAPSPAPAAAPQPTALTLPGSTSLYPELNLSEDTQISLEERFKKPYAGVTDHNDLRDAYDVAERVGLLKKLFTKAEHASIPEQRRFLKLYKNILLSPKEHWLVKRQALRNAAPLWSFLNEKERDGILHKVDLRARSLWRSTERELASEIVGSYEK